MVCGFDLLQYGDNRTDAFCILMSMDGLLSRIIMNIIRNVLILYGLCFMLLQGNGRIDRLDLFVDESLVSLLLFRTTGLKVKGYVVVLRHADRLRSKVLNSHSRVRVLYEFHGVSEEVSSSRRTTCKVHVSVNY